MAKAAPEPVAPDIDDATLVARVSSGDRDAFEALYDRHKGALFRTALAVTRETATAEELLQEAFVRAYRHIQRVELKPGASLRPWLHRILINLSYDWAARQRTASSAIERAADRFLPEAIVSPERNLETRELQRVVGDAVAELPFKQRIVIILFYLHEMDLIEISETLNVPPGTVKSRLHYGRSRLKACLLSDARLAASMEMGYASA